MRLPDELIETEEQAKEAGIDEGFSFPPEVLLQWHPCGCCNYEAMVRTAYDFMVWASEKDGRPACAGMKDEGLFYWIATMFDDAGFLEHGGTIRYSWLTPEGYDFMEKLKERIDKGWD